MKRYRQLSMFHLCLAISFLATLFVSGASADPLRGRNVRKFAQLPMDNTLVPSSTANQQRYWGHDELSTAYSTTTIVNGFPVVSPYRGTFMADDFADKFSTPVVHVTWWGSYLNNINLFPIDKFLISFESDVPVGPDNPFSHPGQPLLNQIVRRVPVGGLTPGSGTFTEAPISVGGPPLNEVLYQYNAELHLGKEFFQKPDTVYWLKIVALVDVPPGVIVDPSQPPPTFLPRWGWHNRDYTIHDPLASTPPAVVPGEHIDHLFPPVVAGGSPTPVWHFQDDAVTGRVVVDHLSTAMGQIMPRVEQGQFQSRNYITGQDGPPPIGEFSKDLAFVLYTVPEPAAVMLLVVALVSVAAFRRRGC